MIKKINHDQLRRCITLLWMADIPACIVGSVGTGKTTAVESLVEKIKQQQPDFKLWKVFLGLIDATDIGGIPHKGEDGMVDYMPPRCLPFGSNEPGIIFGDEYDRAAPDVQNAFNQILLGREIHNNKISNNAYVVLAMNGETDSYTTPLSKAARNRVCTLFLTADSSGNQNNWDKWARENDVNIDVRGFSRFTSNNNEDNDFDYTELALDTPRSRDMAGKILDAASKAEFETKDILLPCLSGVIGSGQAHELIAYLDMKENLIDIKTVLNNDDTYKEYVESEEYESPDVVYLMCSAIANHVSSYPKDGEKAIKLINDKYTPEIKTWAIDNLLSINPDLATSNEYLSFHREMKEFL